jgi:hypothetical protein
VAIKILAVVFALFALRRVIIRYRKGDTLTVEFVFWTLIFSGIGVVVFVPEKTDQVARWLGVSSGFNAFTFLAIAGLLFSVFRLIARVHSIEREVTRLVRAQAIDGATRVAPRAESARKPE